MSDLSRIRREQAQQAKRNEKYRRELQKYGGPRKVVASGRSAHGFWTKLVERIQPSSGRAALTRAK